MLPMFSFSITQEKLKENFKKKKNLEKSIPMDLQWLYNNYPLQDKVKMVFLKVIIH